MPSVYLGHVTCTIYTNGHVTFTTYTNSSFLRIFHMKFDIFQWKCLKIVKDNSHDRAFGSGELIKT